MHFFKFKIVIFICIGFLLLMFISVVQAQDKKNSLAGQYAIGGGWGVKHATITDSTLPRVLLIGDSMLGGYGDEVVELLKGKANVDRWTTPRFVGDTLCEQLKTVVVGIPYALIHFNEAGLHSLSSDRVPTGQYGLRMAEFIKTMKAVAPKAKLIWANTTPVTVKGRPGVLNDTLTSVVVEHNSATAPIVKAYGIATDDLYTLMMNHLDLAKGDQWHWNTKGRSVMAKAVAASILMYLQVK